MDNAVGADEVLMRNNDVFAVFEVAGEAFPGFATHYDFVASGGVAEKLHIFFDMKDKLVAFAEFAVFADGCN